MSNLCLVANEKNLILLKNIDEDDWSTRGPLFRYKAYNLSMKYPSKGLLRKVVIDPVQLKKDYQKYFSVKKKKSLEKEFADVEVNAEDNNTDEKSKVEPDLSTKELVLEKKEKTIEVDHENEIVKLKKEQEVFRLTLKIKDDEIENIKKELFILNNSRKVLQENAISLNEDFDNMRKAYKLHIDNIEVRHEKHMLELEEKFKSRYEQMEANIITKLQSSRQKVSIIDS